MAQYSNTLQTAVAFFNALNKQLTEGTQYPFESLYRSLPNIPSSAVWSDPVPYAVDATAADAVVTANPGVVHKYTQVNLTAIPGSNNQAWYLNDTGKFITNWIAPTDIPEGTTNAPSYGYQASLYDSGSTLITPTQGRWNIFYAQGIVLFEAGFTPVDMGWGTPKITCYNYIGDKGAGYPVTKHTISHTDLQTAALTNNATLITLPARGTIESVTIKHSTAFAGTGITSYKVSVGVLGDANKYSSDFDVAQAVSSNTFLMSVSPNIESFTSGVQIKLFATSIGANLDQSTSGSLDVFIKQSVFP